jgi:predicted RNA-binding protein with PIN domain
MPYLVDGNNVMGQRVGWHRDRAGARRRLLDDLARFASRRRVSVMVVFDGAPEKHFADGASYRGVRVFYAARGSNADERIKQMVDASRERRTLQVVTSDRALADYVRRSGAQVIRSGEFRRRLDDVGAESLGERSPRGTSRRGDDQTELDQWMRYFGVAPEDDEGKDEG